MDGLQCVGEGADVAGGQGGGLDLDFGEPVSDIRFTLYWVTKRVTSVTKGVTSGLDGK
jgi:hypothetical protein